MIVTSEQATLMEMLIPMIIVALVALIRTAISRDDRPDGMYHYHYCCIALLTFFFSSNVYHTIMMDG
jgi:hypothetical protein